jgi:hypothetical protein
MEKRMDWSYCFWIALGAIVVYVFYILDVVTEAKRREEIRDEMSREIGADQEEVEAEMEPSFVGMTIGGHFIDDMILQEQERLGRA